MGDPLGILDYWKLLLTQAGALNGRLSSCAWLRQLGKTADPLSAQALGKSGLSEPRLLLLSLLTCCGEVKSVTLGRAHPRPWQLKQLSPPLQLPQHLTKRDMPSFHMP